MRLTLCREADHTPRLFTWIDNLPLETVRRVIHLLYPETREWTFASDADSGDSDNTIFKCITWSQTVDHDHGRQYQSAMSICIQPPWALSIRDLERFCGRQSVRMANSIKLLHANIHYQFFGSFSASPFKSIHEYPTTSHERLWYKVRGDASAINH
jgi:hypothetical protein